MKHIMLVEDEVELAQLVRDYLEAAGFEVSMFHDGQEAYDSFTQRKPSLMILDLMVPRMDGLTICRKVREQSDLPIIIGGLTRLWQPLPLKFMRKATGVHRLPPTLVLLALPNSCPPPPNGSQASMTTSRKMTRPVRNGLSEPCCNITTFSISESAPLMNATAWEKHCQLITAALAGYSVTRSLRGNKGLTL